MPKSFLGRFGQAGLGSDGLWLPGSSGSQAWGSGGQPVEALRSHACQTSRHQGCSQSLASEAGAVGRRVCILFQDAANI